MGEVAESLLKHMPDASGFDIPFAELRDRQVAAMNERFQEQVGRIKLVKLRAQDADVTEIAKLEDVIPLLLPHTAYKSYPESFLTEKKWDRLTKWLGTVSAYPTDGVDLSEVREIDDWVEACAKAGLFVACSSGTTGKSAMLVASRKDLDFASQDGINAVQWGSAIRAGDMRTSAGAAGAVAYTHKNAAMGMAMMGAFVDPDAPRFQSGLPPVTVGSLTKMITLRKAIADGTAKPGEIQEYETETESRQKGLDDAQVRAVEDIIAKRNEKLYITGMWGALYPFADGGTRQGLRRQGLPPAERRLSRRRAQAREAARRLPRIRLRDLQSPARIHLPDVRHAGTRQLDAALPAGAALSRAAVAGLPAAQQGGRCAGPRGG
ncbi:hypothetical protein WG901_06575 [Novosphingobium sp. PS1R-30]|uniref:Uncharacterized protein n=1 Tax=Novosphingobium anseongense TaxID=3133436 RepID=A0ABU8RTE7_9SPHN